MAWVCLCVTFRGRDTSPPPPLCPPGGQQPGPRAASLPSGPWRCRDGKEPTLLQAGGSGAQVLGSQRLCAAAVTLGQSPPRPPGRRTPAGEHRPAARAGRRVWGLQKAGVERRSQGQRLSPPGLCRGPRRPALGQGLSLGLSCPQRSEVKQNHMKSPTRLCGWPAKPAISYGPAEGSTRKTALGLAEGAGQRGTRSHVRRRHKEQPLCYNTCFCHPPNTTRPVVTMTLRVTSSPAHSPLPKPAAEPIGSARTACPGQAWPALMSPWS